jgi:Domain of unknown function (DUF305)
MQMTSAHDRHRHSLWALSVAALAGASAAFVALSTSAGPMRTAAVDAFMTICSSGGSTQSGFAADNAAAMTKMMLGMAVKPSGDIDRDFAAMMVPHHQGAIEMAQAELRHGSNEQLRRIAQGIIVEQQQEIAAMHLALGQALPPSEPAPTQISYR